MVLKLFEKDADSDKHAVYGMCEQRALSLKARTFYRKGIVVKCWRSGHLPYIATTGCHCHRLPRWCIYRGGSKSTTRYQCHSLPRLYIVVSRHY